MHEVNGKKGTQHTRILFGKLFYTKKNASEITLALHFRDFLCIFAAWD